MKYYLEITTREKYPSTLGVPNLVKLYSNNEELLTEISMLIRKLPPYERKSIEVNLFKTEEKILTFEL